MAWFPWVAMPARSQSPDELIDWLRYSAIEFGAPPQFIDSIDELRDLADAGDRIALLEEKLEDAEQERDDARQALLQAK